MSDVHWPWRWGQPGSRRRTCSIRPLGGGGCQRSRSSSARSLPGRPTPRHPVTRYPPPRPDARAGSARRALNRTASNACHQVHCRVLPTPDVFHCPPTPLRHSVDAHTPQTVPCKPQHPGGGGGACWSRAPTRQAACTRPVRDAAATGRGRSGLMRARPVAIRAAAAPAAAASSVPDAPHLRRRRAAPSPSRWRKTLKTAPRRRGRPPREPRLAGCGAPPPPRPGEFAGRAGGEGAARRAAGARRSTGRW